MTKLTLNKAAKEAGVAKTTLLDAIKSKRMTAPKNDRGHYAIDPAELFRVFPKTTENQSEEPNPTTQENLSKTSALEVEVKLLREMLEKSEAQCEKWEAQAQKITALVEDKRDMKKGFWARLTGG